MAEYAIDFMTRSEQNTMVGDNPLRRQRATNNPYWQAAKLAGERLIWDLRLQSWVSRERLKALRDTHRGEKAVVLCNGPSLLKSDLGLLDGVFTFGLNKINLLFDKSEFRPSCIVAVNPLVIEQNETFYNQTDIPLFLDAYATRCVRSRKNVAFLRSTSHRYFARDCSMSIFQGATVTYVALQLAFHMGFTQVALIGADHNFATKGPANKEVVSGSRDESHFDPHYFSGGVKWHLPDLFESEVAYTMAKNMFKAYDRTVVNCSKGGRLEIFPRQELDAFLNT